MTIPQAQSIALSPRLSQLRLAASLLVLSGLLLFARELAMSFPGGASGPTTRLTISAVLAWALLRRHMWAWWAAILVGSLWLVMDFMTVAAMFALDMSLEPLYQWPLFPLVGAFIAQAVAMALLLQMKVGLSSARTLSVLFLGLIVVVVGFWILTSRADLIPAQNDLGGSIYSAVAERVNTPAVKVWIGTMNGEKGVRVVIADSALVGADSARQAPRSRELAGLVRSLLPTESDLEFIGIGWSLDTGPGMMPVRIHRFSLDELEREAAAAP